MEIWSQFGSFSKPFSNTGGILTYLIPPKTAIIGMIGSVLGYNVEDYREDESGNRRYRIEELYDIGVSIQPVFELITKRITFNSHYGNKSGLLNAKQDTLINPKYILYLSFPNGLSAQKEEFMRSIQKKETIYNLYMGRNNFPLNYEVLGHYKSCEMREIREMFEAAENERVYGTLNREIIKEAKITTYEEKKEIYSNNIKRQIKKFATEYDYFIRDYPVKRTNFTDFEYIPVSFFSTIYSRKKPALDTYYSYFKVKKGSTVRLYGIGDGRWITLI